MSDVASLRVDAQTSALVDAYLDLFKIRYDSPHRELAKKAMHVLRDQIAERTGVSPADVQSACFISGAH